MNTAATPVLLPLHADDKSVISKLGYEREVQQLREGIVAGIRHRERGNALAA